MGVTEMVLIAATFLTSLTTGLVYTFAVVVMPGIRELPDGAFIRSFQVMDGVIQRNSPLFMLVWVGSVLALIACSVLCVMHWEWGEAVWVLGATVAYVLGVQVPTGLINVPLNNRLQQLRVDELDADRLRSERRAFEGRWVRWNTNRTIVATLVSLVLLVVLSLHGNG